MSDKNLITGLSPHLFWDMDKQQLDVQLQSKQLIQRVLEYGNVADWRLVRDYYGLDRIVSDCKQMRTLDARALAFVCVVSQTNKEDYRCYRFKQSFPTLWNS